MTPREHLSARLTTAVLLGALVALASATLSLAQVSETIPQNGRIDIAAITDSAVPRDELREE